MNQEKNWGPVSKPPLGEKPDFEKIDKEKSEKRSNLEYITVDKYPDISRILTNSSNEINSLLKKLEIEEISFEFSNIRLIKKEIWDINSGILENREAEAFFDPVSRISFIRIENEDLENNLEQKITVLYKTLHEYTHSAMKGSGIMEYSLELNEGIADLTTKRILNKELSILLSNRNIKECEEFANNHKVDDVIIYPDDIMLLEENKLPIAYTRIPQMRLVEAIENKNPGVEEKLMKAAFSGNNGEAKRIMTEIFGVKTAEIFQNTNIKTKDLISEINSLPKK